MNLKTVDLNLLWVGSFGVKNVGRSGPRSPWQTKRITTQFACGWRCLST
jgi:hypothetical protein